MKNLLRILIVILIPFAGMAQKDTTVFFKNYKPLPDSKGADFRVIVEKKNEKNLLMHESTFKKGEWKFVVTRTIKRKDENTFVIKSHGRTFTRKFKIIPGGFQVEDYNYKGELQKSGFATCLFPLLKHGQWKSYTDGIVTGISSYKNGTLVRSYITDGNKNLWPNNTYANADSLAQYKKHPLDFARDISKHIEYPKSCMAKGLGGRVLILFAISKTGNPCDIHIFRSIHPDLNVAAANAVKKCKGWTPAMKNGKPVKVYTVVPVNFRIR
jgi:TonB family protein